MNPRLLALPVAASIVACATFAGDDAPPPPPPADASTPVDAAIDASDARADACTSVRAPTNPCFTTGGCGLAQTKLDSIAHEGGFALKYPHGLARWRDRLFFAVQDESTEGRNRNGRGYVFSVALPGMNDLTRVTDVLEAPAALTVSGDHLYWRERRDGTSGIRRIDLTAGKTCFATAGCTGEAVASGLTTVEQIWVAADGDVFFRLGGAGLGRVVRGPGGAWGVPIALSNPVRGYLAPGLWTMVSSEYATYSLPGTLSAPAATWPLDGGPSFGLVSTHCGSAFLYDAEATVNALHALPDDGGRPAPIPCATGCEPRRIYDFAADGSFVYVASSDSGHVRAIPVDGGPATTLVTGDIWYVAADDDAVYFGDVSGSRVGRIPKHTGN